MPVLFLRQIWLHPIAFAALFFPLLGHYLLLGSGGILLEAICELGNGAQTLLVVPLFGFHLEIPKQLALAIMAYLPITDIFAGLWCSLFLSTILEIFASFPQILMRQVRFIYLPAFSISWALCFLLANHFCFSVGMGEGPPLLRACELWSRFNSILSVFASVVSVSFLLAAWNAAIFSIIFLGFQALRLPGRLKLKGICFSCS